MRDALNIKYIRSERWIKGPKNLYILLEEKVLIDIGERRLIFYMFSHVLHFKHFETMF